MSKPFADVKMHSVGVDGTRNMIVQQSVSTYDHLYFNTTVPGTPGVYINAKQARELVRRIEEWLEDKGAPKEPVLWTEG